MPRTTKPPPTHQPPLPSLAGSKLGAFGPALALAAGAALLELLAGLFLGAFPLTGRAEAFLFLLARPWVVLLVALTAAWRGWRSPMRLAAYAAFLILAGLSESHLMLRLGNSSPWAEMLRGWAGGAAVALLADVLLSLARRRGKRWLLAAAGALSVLLALPSVRQAYEQVIAEPLPRPSAQPKPQVLLMTALPLVWGEGGAFDPNSRPAALYNALGREFALRPIDVLDEASLAAAPLLLLIQPRWLAPEELVALDGWVRRGGRALILTDPRLSWHSELPLGDIRRPPPAGLLKPLLDHWGLAMELGPRWSDGSFPGNRRLVTEHPGRLTARGSDCRVAQAFFAECSLGQGKALILADADLARDELWAGEKADGASRHRRLSDNPLVVADLLDRLAQVQRPRALGDARWRRADASLPDALLWAVLPLAVLVLAGLAAPLLQRPGKG
jgi:hypothetical protein